MDLMTLVAKFTADTTQFEKGIKSAQSSMEQGRATAEKLDATLGKLKGAFAAVVSVAGIAKIGSAIKGLADSTAAAADRIDKQAQALGMSRKAFQQWDYILGQSGASIDSLGVSMKTLNSSLLNPSDGTIEALNTLGINLEQIQGLSQEDAFEMMVRQFQKLPEGATKSALAMQMFGKQGQALMPLLNSSEDSIDSLRKDMERLGFTMSDSMVDAGVKYGDTMDNLKRTFGGLKSIIGYGFMEPLTGIMETITNFFSQQDVQDAVKRFAVNMHDLGNVVLTHVQEFFDWLKENGETLSEKLGNIGAFIGDIAAAIGGFAIDTLQEMVGAFTEFFENASPGQIAAVAGLALTLGLLLAPIPTLAAAVLTLASNWKELKQWAGEAAEKLDDWKDEKLADVKQGLANLNEKFSGVGSAVDAARDNVRTFFTTGELPEGTPEWIKAPIEAVQNAWGGITDAIDTVKTNMSAFFETGELPEDAPEWLKKPLEAVGGAWDTVVGSINGVTSAISSFFESGEIPDSVPAWLKDPLQSIYDTWDSIRTAISDLTNAISAFFGGEELSIELPGWVESVLYAIRDAWDWITDAVDTVRFEVNNFFENVKPTLPPWVQSVLDVIATAWDMITQAVNHARNRISTFFSSGFKLPGWYDFLESIRSKFASIKTWAENALAAVRNFFQGSGGASLPSGSGLTSSNMGTRLNTWQAYEDAWNNQASGLDYVPKNSYKANLHEGEAVLNKRDAEEWRRGGNKGATAAEIAEAVSSSLDGMAVMMGKDVVGRLVAQVVGRELEREARAGRFVTA